MKKAILIIYLFIFLAACQPYRTTPTLDLLLLKRSKDKKEARQATKELAAREKKGVWITKSNRMFVNNNLIIKK